MILTSKDALELLNNQKGNPQRREYIINHMITVGNAAGKIAEALNMDSDKAKMMGYIHDIGKFLDDEMGMNHRDIGPILAAPILKDVGFSEEETEMICHAIKMHGTYPEDKGSLAGLLYIADKKARRCFDCPAHDECNWPDEKKNEVLYG